MWLFSWLLNILGCGHNRHKTVLRAAVLRELHPRMSRFDNYLSVWISHNYDLAYWTPILNQQAAEVDRVRKWSEGLEDKYTASAYAYWLEYYQGRIDSAFAELRDQKTKKRMDQFDVKSRAREESVKKYRDGSIFPVPPKAICLNAR